MAEARRISRQAKRLGLLAVQPVPVQRQEEEVLAVGEEEEGLCRNEASARDGFQRRQPENEGSVPGDASRSLSVTQRHILPNYTLPNYILPNYILPN